jgi:hypothetical protein
VIVYWEAEIEGTREAEAYDGKRKVQGMLSSIRETPHKMQIEDSECKDIIHYHLTPCAWISLTT